MGVPVDKSKAGTIWQDADGRRYTERARVDGLGGVEEVDLKPEHTWMLEGWFNAQEIATMGLREVPS